MATAVEKKVMRFRVKAGIHLEGGKTFKKGQEVDRAFTGDGPEGVTDYQVGDRIEIEKVRCPSKWYRARGTPGYRPGSDIIETETDLVKKHGRDKFERLPDNPSPDDYLADEEAEIDLERMSVKQLHEIADAEEIDLEGAGKKADIIAKIRAASKNFNR